MPLIVVLGLVCLFIPGVFKCSHPGGVPFVTWPWRGNPRGVLLALGGGVMLHIRYECSCL